MDGDNIKKLLDKFYGVTATEAEDQALAELLESGAWPQGMEADCRAARALLCARCPAMPPGLEQAIGRSIDKLATQQRPKRRWPAVACAAAPAWKPSRHSRCSPQCSTTASPKWAGQELK